MRGNCAPTANLSSLLLPKIMPVIIKPMGHLSDATRKPTVLLSALRGSAAWGLCFLSHCPPCSGRRRNIYLHSSSSTPRFATCSTFPKLGHPPTLAIRAQYIRRKMTMKPPPRRIGQEATAAPHRARSHRRASSGKKPVGLACG